MSPSYWGKYLIAAAVLPIVLTLTWSSFNANGQQAGAKTAKDDKKPAAAKEEPKKAQGQLPPYYGKVVTDAQKEKIYEIQAKYRTQLDALEDQLKALRAKRDAEVEGVLDASQLAKVKAAKEEAAAAKKKPADKPAEKSADTKPAEKKP